MPAGIVRSIKGDGVAACDAQLQRPLYGRPEMTTKKSVRIRKGQPHPEDNGMPNASGTTAAKSAAPKKGKRKPSKTEPKAKKTSALDAAAKVLAEAGAPMNCQEMIAAMADKGLDEPRQQDARRHALFRDSARAQDQEGRSAFPQDRARQVRDARQGIEHQHGCFPRGLATAGPRWPSPLRQLNRVNSGDVVIAGGPRHLLAFDTEANLRLVGLGRAQSDDQLAGLRRRQDKRIKGPAAEAVRQKAAFGIENIEEVVPAAVPLQPVELRGNLDGVREGLPHVVLREFHDLAELRRGPGCRRVVIATCTRGMHTDAWHGPRPEPP